MEGKLDECTNTDEYKVNIVCVEEAEMDEMWSFYHDKSKQRWLWHAIDN